MSPSALFSSGGEKCLFQVHLPKTWFADSKGTSHTRFSSQSILRGSDLTVSENSTQNPFQTTALHQLMGESFLALRLHHLRSVTDSCSAQTGPHSKTKGLFLSGFCGVVWKHAVVIVISKGHEAFLSFEEKKTLFYGIFQVEKDLNDLF